MIGKNNLKRKHSPNKNLPQRVFHVSTLVELLFRGVKSLCCQGFADRQTDRKYLYHWCKNTFYNV